MSSVPLLKVHIDVEENLQYILFVTGSHYGVLAGLKLTVWPSWPQTHRGTCLGLPSAQIKSVCCDSLKN